MIHRKSYFLLVALLFFCACKKHEPKQESVYTDPTSEMEGFGLIDQSVLALMYNNAKFDETLHTMPNGNSSYYKVWDVDGEPVTIRKIPNADGRNIFVVMPGAFPRDNNTVYVFDRDIPPSQLGNATRSYADTDILDKLDKLGGQGYAGEHYLAGDGRIGIYFNENPKISHREIHTTTDIYLTTAEMKELKSPTLNDSLMGKINRLHQMMHAQNKYQGKDTELFVKVGGHGDIGSMVISDDAGKSYSLSEYPAFLKTMLGERIPTDIHVEMSSCMAGATSAEGRSMLGQMLTEFRSTFGHDVHLAGNAAATLVNFGAVLDAKLVWQPYLNPKTKMWSLEPFDINKVVAGNVLAKLDADNKIRYSVLGLPQGKVAEDPVYKGLVDARAFLINEISKIQNPSGQGLVSVSEIEVQHASAALDAGKPIGQDAPSLFAKLSVIEEHFYGYPDKVSADDVFNDIQKVTDGTNFIAQQREAAKKEKELAIKKQKEAEDLLKAQKAAEEEFTRLQEKDRKAAEWLKAQEEAAAKEAELKKQMEKEKALIAEQQAKAKKMHEDLMRAKQEEQRKALEDAERDLRNKQEADLKAQQEATRLAEEKERLAKQEAERIAAQDQAKAQQEARKKMLAEREALKRKAEAAIEARQEAVRAKDNASMKEKIATLVEDAAKPEKVAEIKAKPLLPPRLNPVLDREKPDTKKKSLSKGTIALGVVVTAAIIAASVGFIVVEANQN